jgi:hypothetical protein
MKYLILVLTLFFLTSSWAQVKRKISTNKGAVFVQWGYNRAHYTKSNLKIVGPGYDLTFAGVKAIDRPEPFSAENYLNPRYITVPQFNLRAGYYFKDGWAVSFGYDHFKYVVKDRNEVNLSGRIEPGIDTVTNYSGLYTGQNVTTDYNTFHYENTNGMNYIRLELMRSYNLYSPRKNKKFGIVGNLGLSAGAVLSMNDFNFLGTFNRVTTSLSGYGVSANSSVRFEFFKHLYLQTSLNSGFIHQLKVRTRPNDPSSYARQALGFVEYNVLIGGIFYLNPKAKCDDCPNW